MNREGCIPPAQGGAPKTGGGPGGAPQVIAGLAPGMHGQRAGYVCVGASATVRAWPLTYTDTPDMVDCGPRRARARRRRRSDTPDMVDSRQTWNVYQSGCAILPAAPPVGRWPGDPMAGMPDMALRPYRAILALSTVLPCDIRRYRPIPPRITIRIPPGGIRCNLPATFGLRRA